jgi:hypothetical protein
MRFLVLCVTCVIAIGCTGKHSAGIEDLGTHQELTMFKLGSLRGTRDGDRLDAQAMFTDSSSILTIELHFAVGSPTRLDSGNWRWQRSGRRDTGNVTARSVSFLGGQDGPPSFGGTFDLVSNGAALYRVTIPLTELKTRWNVR